MVLHADITSQRRAAQFRCQSPADADKFRCRRTRSNRVQAVDIALFLGGRKAIFGVKTRFLPHSRDMRWGPGRPDRAAGLLRGRSAVDYEARTGHKAGIVGGEKDDAFGNVVGHAEPADRMP